MGAIIYEILSEKKPWHKTPTDIFVINIVINLKKDQKKFFDYNDRFGDTELEKLVEKCMEVEITDRFDG